MQGKKNINIVGFDQKYSSVKKIKIFNNEYTKILKIWPFKKILKNMSLMVVGWWSKTTLHIQSIITFRIATSINVFNLWQFKMFWLVVCTKVFWTVNPPPLNSKNIL